MDTRKEQIPRNKTNKFLEMQNQTGHMKQVKEDLNNCNIKIEDRYNREHLRKITNQMKRRN